jgi:peroxiredoxin
MCSSHRISVREQKNFIIGLGLNSCQDSVLSHARMNLPFLSNFTVRDLSYVGAWPSITMILCISLLGLTLARSSRADSLPLVDASQIGLPAGVATPDFSLPDQVGRSRDFASLSGPRGLVLVFFRSADWCIYCKSQLVQLQRDYAALKQSGYGIAAISYDSSGVLNEFATRKRIQFPLLADHESTLIRAFGVVDREFRKGMQVDVQTEKIYVSSLGNVPVYGIAYPAVFVIGLDRKVIWRFVSESAELRLTGSTILERAVGENITAYRSVPQGSIVKVSATATTTVAGLGSRLTAGVEIGMPKDFHIYGPKAGKEFRSLAWRMNPSQCWAIGETAYPEARWQTLPFSEEKLPVYEGTIQLTRELIVQPAIRADDPSVFELFRKTCLDAHSQITASGVLDMQACDDRQCFPPKSILLAWKFNFIAPDRQRSPVDLRREFEP